MAEAQKAAAKADEKETKAEKEAKEAAVPEHGYTSHEVTYADQLNRSLGISRPVALAYARAEEIDTTNVTEQSQAKVGELASIAWNEMDGDAQAKELDVSKADVQAAREHLAGG